MTDKNLSNSIHKNEEISISPDVTKNKALQQPKDAKSILEILFYTKTKIKISDETTCAKDFKPVRHVSVENPKYRKLSNVSNYLDNPRESTTVAEPRSTRTAVGNVALIHLSSLDLDPDTRLACIHNGFIRKVYGILALQFLFTLAVLLIVYFIHPSNQFFHALRYVFCGVFMFNYVFIAVVLVVCDEWMKNFPYNLILMLLITISLTIAIIGYSTYYSIVYVIYSCSIAVIIMSTMFLVGYQKRWDLTKNIMCFWASVYITLVTGIGIAVLLYQGYERHIYRVIIAGVTILLFTLWTICMTRRLTKVRHGVFTVQDYIFGALTLYVSPILLILFVIEVVKYCRKV